MLELCPYAAARVTRTMKRKYNAIGYKGMRGKGGKGGTHFTVRFCFPSLPSHSVKETTFTNSFLSQGCSVRRKLKTQLKRLTPKRTHVMDRKELKL